jgi:hypothetical protein
MSPAPFRFPRSIATVSLAGTLPEKLEAAGSVGFDSIRAFRERPVDLLCLPDRGKGVVNAAKHHTRWATSFPRPGSGFDAHNHWGGSVQLQRDETRAYTGTHSRLDLVSWPGRLFCEKT